MKQGENVTKTGREKETALDRRERESQSSSIPVES